MNSLFVDKRGIELRVDNNALTIYEKNLRVSTIPLAPIKRIFLQGDVQLSASVLAKLGDYQIGVVVLYGYKAQPTLLMPTYSKDAQRRQAQYKTSLDPLLSLSYARLLVAQKLQGHVIILQEMASLQPKAKLVLSKAIQRIEGINGRPLHQCTSVETLRGLEGAAAACYFEALAHVLPDSIGFDGRNRRPPKDPFNALVIVGLCLITQRGRFGDSCRRFRSAYWFLSHGNAWP
jgi:CRISPR-associated protein Cas1